MAAVQSSTDLQHSKDIERDITRFLKQLLSQFNGNIEFHKNVRSSSLLTFSFTAVDTNITVNHDLNRIPVGYLAVSLTVPMSIYIGSLPWSSTSITLKSNTIGTALIYAI